MCQSSGASLSSLRGFPTLVDIKKAAHRLEPIIKRTPTEFSVRLSEECKRHVFLKREDLQLIRSFKLRGALNKLLGLSENQRNSGVVCASAGNHAQGFAFACRLLKVKGVVFLPQNTPKQKIQQVVYYGKEWINLVLVGTNFNQAYEESIVFANNNRKIYIHPFDDIDVIVGQGTLALEMIADLPLDLDCVLVPVGGGGLASGVACVYKLLSPKTKIIGVEVEGAAVMADSLERKARTFMPDVDSFADGTAVAQVGKLPFDMCLKFLDDVIVVSKKAVCRALIELNNKHGMVVEPSGALSVAALTNKTIDDYKTVACIISGGNNDAARFIEYTQILES